MGSQQEDSVIFSAVGKYDYPETMLSVLTKGVHKYLCFFTFSGQRLTA